MQLSEILRHCNSIDYSFKHILVRTNKKNLFLSDAILKLDFDKLDFEDNYYFCFPDLNEDFNISQNCLTHSQASEHIKNL